MPQTAFANYILYADYYARIDRAACYVRLYASYYPRLMIDVLRHFFWQRKSGGPR